MKKALALTLAMVLLLTASLAGCGNNEEEGGRCPASIPQRITRL